MSAPSTPASFCRTLREVRGYADEALKFNRDLVEGVLDGAGMQGFSARLAPHDGFCCVRVRA